MSTSYCSREFSSLDTKNLHQSTRSNCVEGIRQHVRGQIDIDRVEGQRQHVRGQIDIDRVEGRRQDVRGQIDIDRVEGQMY